MPRRLPQLLVTLWWLAWVFIILPCHTRGAISIGGCPECDSQNPVPLFFGNVDRPCCNHSNDSQAPLQKPDRRSSGNCAICQLALTTPNAAPALPPLVFLQFLELRPIAASELPQSCPFIPTSRSRAPPAMPALA